MEITSFLKLIFGLLIIFVANIGFGLIIQKYLNSKINKIQSKIDDMSKCRSRLMFNIHMNSNNLVKMAVTYGDYKILDTLNSSHKKEFEKALRTEIYQAIVTLREKGLTSSEKVHLDT